MEEISLAAVLAARMLAGVASEMNLRKPITHTPPSTNIVADSGFETQRRHHQNSKTRVSEAPQKELMSSKKISSQRKTVCGIGFVVDLVWTEICVVLSAFRDYALSVFRSFKSINWCLQQTSNQVYVLPWKYFVSDFLCFHWNVHVFSKNVPLITLFNL